MKKMKLKLSGDDLKQLLANHAEKAVFLVIVVVTLLIMDAGYRKRIKVDRAPDNLESAAAETQQHIENVIWDDVDQDGRPIGERYKREKGLQLAVRGEQANKMIAVNDYVCSLPLDGPIPPPKTLRTDPELFTVEELEVHAGNGPVAFGEGGGRGPEPRGGGGGGGGRKVEGAVGFRPRGNAASVGRRFVVVAGKVPVMRQRGEFDRCLLNSPGYDEERDKPKYAHYFVERIEILPDGSKSEPVTLDARQSVQEAGKWAGNIEEVVAEQYLHKLLTTPLMPVMLRDTSSWQKHSWFPVPSDEPVEDTPDEPADPVGPVAPLGPIGGPAIEEPADGHGGAQRAPGEQPRSRDKEAVAEFLMFRFFDVSVQPGRTYQYRVQLMLSDPNYPRSGTRPDRRDLDSTVIDRVSALPQNTWSYYRRSEWSEPSQPVSVPVDQQILAGGVELGRRTVLDRDRDLGYWPEEPEIKTMALVWDNNVAKDMPGELSLRRGSGLDVTTSVEVLDPVKLAVDSVDGYTFQTGAMVVDIAGGEQLPGRDRNDLIAEPGQLLVIDGEGNLLVRDELDDLVVYRKHKYGEKVDAPEGPTFFPDDDEPDQPTRPPSGHGDLSDEFFN